MVPSRKKEGFRWDVLLDGFGDINSSSGRIRSQTVGLVQRGKPQVGIGLPRSFYSPFDGPFVEELPVSRIITAKYQLVVPSGIIADNFQIGRPWPNPRTVFPTEGARKIPKHAMHGHRIIGLFRRAHIPDSGPFGIPAVGPVVAVARFGQAVKGPFTIPYPYQYGFVIPTRHPDRIGFGV